ncbi:aldehyde dehydrogenase 6B2 [Perilla frutescens var. hirtella]|nr:aldehyde dehydrogenase 6B2 [Perilla frutescens var. hirtella]
MNDKANIRKVPRQTSMENKGNSILSNGSHAGTVLECAKADMHIYSRTSASRKRVQVRVSIYS